MTQEKKIKKLLELVESKEFEIATSNIEMSKEDNIIEVKGTFVLNKILDKEKILDEKEKEYLSNIIKPFKNRVEYIMKTKNFAEEYIAISIKNDCNITLPNYKKNTMYKKMELFQKYSLEDLGL